MRVITTHFNWSDSNQFDRMLKVLIYTVTSCGLPIQVISLGTMEGSRSHKLDNMWKARMLNYAVQNATNGEQLLLVDCDAIMTADPSHVFDQPFDIAITMRSRTGKINSGVVFVRVSERVKQFYEKWLEIQETMFVDAYFMGDWYKQYRGINQAAFMWCRESGIADDLDILELPCRVYNSCTDDHPAPKPQERYIIHMHFGELRKMLFTKKRDIRKTRNLRRHQRMLGLRELWLEKEKEAEHIRVEDYIKIFPEKMQESLMEVV